MKKQLTVNELLKGIEESYAKYFTDSKCVATLELSLYKSISVRCLLANNKNEVANGIWQNDMFSLYFIIDQEGLELDKDTKLETILPETLQIKVSDNSYLIKPENQYLCYSSRKLGYRKTKGDAEKILKTFDKWFKKLSDELKKDIENKNIHDKHIELLKSKIK